MRIAGAFLFIFGLTVGNLPASGQSRADVFFPMAVWYGGGRARAPMLEPNPRAERDRWRADLQKIKELGFNAIRCWVDWATAEPVEGRYRFEAVDLLAELADELGLRVIVQVYADSAPEWIGKKYPDAHFVSIGGERMPVESAPGYCFDHPGVRTALRKFLMALAERMKRYAAFFGWDLWSEPHIVNWASAPYLTHPEFCFCPYTVNRFRQWLKRKYGTLEALNRAWYRRFDDWNDIQPNRLSTILSYTDYIDWRLFIIEKLAEDLRMRYETVTRILPDKVAVSHAAAPGLFTSPAAGDGNPDDWLMARQVDFWGTSFYPKHSFPVGRDPQWRGALLDFTRSACLRSAGFWIGELQGGVGTVGLRISSTVTPNDLRIWTWSAIARGAKGINFYAWYPMSSGYESGGYGLINLDGTITERARAAGEIARIVGAHQDMFIAARPAPAEVAIVYNPLSSLIGGRQSLASAGAQGEAATLTRQSLLGIYRALFPLNVPVDFLHVDEIATGQIERYKLILLPYPLMMNEAAARGVEKYVERGGLVMSEARLAWNDASGRAQEIIPGFGLHRVSGCREASIQQTPSARTDIRIVRGDESIPELQPGDRLRGALYEEALQPIAPSARVIATFPDGSPAIVVSSYGKGKMITVGSFLGALYEAERDENVARFFAGLLRWAGVRRPVQIFNGASSGLIEVRTMTAGQDELVFVFNHGSDPAEPTIGLEPPAGTYAARNLVTDEVIAVAYERELLLMKVRVGGNDVSVIRLSRK